MCPSKLHHPLHVAWDAFAYTLGIFFFLSVFAYGQKPKGSGTVVRAITLSAPVAVMEDFSGAKTPIAVSTYNGYKSSPLPTGWKAYVQDGFSTGTQPVQGDIWIDGQGNIILETSLTVAQNVMSRVNLSVGYTLTGLYPLLTVMPNPNNCTLVSGVLSCP